MSPGQGSKGLCESGTPRGFRNKNTVRAGWDRVTGTRQHVWETPLARTKAIQASRIMMEQLQPSDSGRSMASFT